MGFLSNVFDTTSHIIYFDYKHLHFMKIKTIHVLHKISFHNTIPHRSHSLIGHVIQELKVVKYIEMPKACPKKSMCHFQKLEMILK